MRNAFIGTSGFYYASWIGDFYPEDIKKAALLSYYATRFKTVEINSSFYHLPREQTVKNWKDKVPPDFVFTFKLSRFITHVKKLLAADESFELFFERMKVFAQKNPKHLVLVQIPSSLKKDIDRLSAFLQKLPTSFLYAFEARHPSWFAEDVYTLLKKHNVALVLSDSPIQTGETRLWPYHDIDTADFFYIRFHGSKKLFYSSYTDEELEFYASLIKKKLKKGVDVYAYFNNDAAGHATRNAQTLQENLERLLRKKSDTI